MDLTFAISWRMGLYGDTAYRIVEQAVDVIKLDKHFDLLSDDVYIGRECDGEIVVGIGYDRENYPVDPPGWINKSWNELSVSKIRKIVAEHIKENVIDRSCRWKRGSKEYVDELDFTVEEAYATHGALLGYAGWADGLSEEVKAGIAGEPFDPMRVELERAYKDEVDRVYRETQQKLNESRIEESLASKACKQKLKEIAEHGNRQRGQIVANRKRTLACLRKKLGLAA